MMHVAEFARTTFDEFAGPEPECSQCHTREGETDLTETGRKSGQYTCSPACTSQLLYEATETAAGKNDLRCFLAALYLIDEADIEARCPMADYDMEFVAIGSREALDLRYISLHEFRQAALGFLKLLAPEETRWNSEVPTAVAELQEKVGGDQ